MFHDVFLYFIYQGIEQQLWDIAELTFEQTFTWEYWFQHLPTGPVAADNITLYTVGCSANFHLILCSTSPSA
jgi:hypothetical protein